jgi:RNA polymerase sigma-70 factor (ECF subfamily)
MAVTDEEYYDRFIKYRDEDDLAALLARHRESLMLFIDSYVHDLCDAEELMMDAFAAVAAGRTMFSGRSSFKTWLFSIGKKLALLHIRGKRQYSPLDENTPGAQTDAPELELLKKERNRELYAALERINEDYRTILILLYFEGMDHEEAGRVMGKNKRQIYHLAERGRKALREELEKAGFDHYA